MVIGSSASYSLAVNLVSCSCSASSFTDTASITFITLSGGTYVISPPLNDFVNLGMHTVTYNAIDASNTFSEAHFFTVNVINTAPTYVSTPNYLTYPGVTSTYILPGT